MVIVSTLASRAFYFLPVLFPILPALPVFPDFPVLPT
jgi:hypothetical protein